ncbi:hypothetical protein, partial [Lysinibacillus sp. D4B2_S17]|uniref:hypothetical protein n=1 Tax=Lysinibacillus sp. D4B2_S17 TaxID=2941225 RepID=UPI0020C0E9CF
LVTFFIVVVSPAGYFTASSGLLFSGLINVLIIVSLGTINWLPYCFVSTDGSWALFSSVTFIGVSIV